MTPATLQAPVTADTSASAVPGPFQLYFSRFTSGSPARWSLTTLCGLFALIVIWAALFHATWATWGNLTIDSGHEMYVPTVLSQGKTLYRDVWFTYPPLAPYLYGSS